MPHSHHASILAVGTEITTGQITNRNAAWLSQKLVDLGAEVVLHLTVADDRAMIRSALERCLSSSRLIFVTGGLGPTTDDFTREVVAEWLGKPLVYHEASWAKIQARLNGFGIPIAESNRQQCYYPEGAEVLVNAQGTANGFACAIPGHDARIWVLPGPPREIAAIWETGVVEDAIRVKLPASEKLILRTWQCLGKSEAEVGEITERALEGSGFRTGYRVHMPYVEVKAWGTQRQWLEGANAILALERTLAPWLISRGDEDVASHLLDRLKRASRVEILDAATAGTLTERLGALIRSPERQAGGLPIRMVTEWLAPGLPSTRVARALDEADPAALTLAISGFDGEGQWALGLRHGALKRVETLPSPYRKAELLDRSRRYATEKAISEWARWLDGLDAPEK